MNLELGYLELHAHTQTHTDTDTHTHTHFQDGTSDKEPICQRRRRGFNPWVRKIPWRRAWQLTLVCLPGESHGSRSLAGYHPEGHRELDTIEATYCVVSVYIYKQYTN